MANRSGANRRGADILVLYYSRHGSVQSLAKLVARGIESVSNCTAVLRTVPAISANTEATEEPIPDHGDPYVNQEDFAHCDGLLLGSPTRFGNMAAPLKYFIDQTAPLWIAGALVDKPGGVFTSTSSMHGGQESTLLTMMVPLLHHGMIITGIPFAGTPLSSTQTGGTPYGASHVAGVDNTLPISGDEEKVCLALGRRVAEIATKLQT